MIASEKITETEMNITINEIQDKDIAEAIDIWNNVVKKGNAFPQMQMLSVRSGKDFFAQQTFTAVAEDTVSGKAAGLYILHPNNIGRCGHICNASYAVAQNMRGNGIGEKLVTHCMDKARQKGFRILQFNAVVSTNTSALALYKKLGFIQLGTIPDGFLLSDGTYTDIIPHYIIL